MHNLHFWHWAPLMHTYWQLTDIAKAHEKKTELVHRVCTQLRYSLVNIFISHFMPLSLEKFIQRNFPTHHSLVTRKFLWSFVAKMCLSWNNFMSDTFPQLFLYVKIISCSNYVPMFRPAPQLSQVIYQVSIKKNFQPINLFKLCDIA